VAAFECSVTADGAQTGLTTTQFLGYPIAGMGSPKLMRNQRRMTHDLTHISPNDVIQLLSGDQP
jgi:hypothetical protein